MPRGDRTGPMGMGAMTGRGTGYCHGFAAPEYAEPAGFARGLGCGYGRGCGHGLTHRMRAERAHYGYCAYPGAGGALDEKAFLTSEAELLKNRLEQIKKRLSSLDEKAE